MSTVLVADDEPDIRLMLRLELSAEGHQIVEAADGQEALAVVSESAPDLVLLDMMMPVVDGWEFLRRVDLASAPPIVVITALATDDRHAIDALERGAIDVIAKPFDPGLLVRLCDAVLLVDPHERDEYRRRRLARARRD